LRNAGIFIWMLTGDKIETARNIAISSKLVSRNQQLFQIEKLKDLDVGLELLDLLRNKQDCGLIIDGESLQFYLDHAPKELITVALGLPAVVCSRCTPTQKADIVSLINSSTKKRTCAIGDGGNDVSMIQAANVGIGIVGKEGYVDELTHVHRKTGISRCRLFHYSIFSHREAVAVAWQELVQTILETGSFCDTSRIDNFCHASRVFVLVFLCSYCIIPRIYTCGLYYIIHNGPSV